MRLFKQITAFITALSVLTAFAAPIDASSAELSGELEGGLSWSYSDGLLEISGNGAIPDLSTANAQAWAEVRSGITAVYVGEGITSLGAYCFASSANLTDVSLPDTLEAIGINAFMSCSTLESITIPASVTDIRTPAFFRCSSLSSVQVEAGSSSYVSMNGVLVDVANWAILLYPPAKADTDYTVPDAIREISSYAFSNVAALESLTLSDDTTLMKARSVYYCTKLQTLTIPNASAVLESKALEQCVNLTVRANFATSAHRFAVENGFPFEQLEGEFFVSGKLGESLDWTLDESGVMTVSGTGIPDTESYSEWLDYSYLITSIVFGEGLSELPDSFLKDNTTVKSLTLPETLTKIGCSVFSGCTSLESISIPASCMEIGDSVFEDCKALTSINVSEGNPSYSSIDGVLFDSDCTTLLCYPISAERTEYSLPDSTRIVADKAFINAYKLLTLSFNDGLLEIGDYAFSGCNRIVSIVLPDSLTRLGTYSFYNCTYLESVQLPKALETIEQCAFGLCFRLASVQMPDTLKAINKNAFYGCKALKSAYISPTCKNIHESAFGIGEYLITGLTVVGYTNSFAQSYASEAGLSFESCGILGDMAADGQVTSFDALAVLMACAMRTSPDAETVFNGDCDGDGKLSAHDAYLILTLVNGLSTAV